MAHDEPPLTSEETFKDELQTLLQRAHDGGINVEGGWECRNGPDHPDWETVIAEVAKAEQLD